MLIKLKTKGLLVLSLFKILLCFHFYETKDICPSTLHSQMVCVKCGKSKYKFER